MGKMNLEAILQRFAIDPAEGLQVVSGSNLEVDRLDQGSHLLVIEVVDNFLASEVKLGLMGKYPDEHLVVVLLDEVDRVEQLPLYEIDQIESDVSGMVVYVPPLELDERTKSFATTQYYMDAIQAGDIWVQQQTHETLLPYLIEESEEVAEAVANQDTDNLIEELGDILLQVIYHANHAEQAGTFNLEDIIETLNRKLRRRHPHVFDGYPVSSIEDIDVMWQEIKRKEKENGNET